MIKILYAGRVSPIKDLPTLQKVAKKIGAKLTVNSNYSYDEIPKLFRRFDIIIIPTLSRALDKVFLEALACGVPAIGTDVGYPFMVRLFPRLIFRAGDSQELAQKIDWLVKNKREAGIITATAQKFVRKNFDLDILMDKIVYEFTNTSP